MSLAIPAIATAVPESRIDQTRAAHIARGTCQASPAELTLIEQFYRNSGVRTRHSVLLAPPYECDGASFYPPHRGADDRGPTTAERLRIYEREAAPLAARAAAFALQQAQTDARRITHLVTASCTGFFSPGVDVALIRTLGLPATVARTHVGFMGCHAALNALRVAHALTLTDADSRVLVAAVELCSLHYQYGCQPDHVIANALFADGAAAFVAGCPGSPTDAWHLLATGSTVVPDSTEAMQWVIRDHGFEMSLSPRVPELILDNLRGWLDAWLAQQGFSLRSIASWAIHPGGPRVLQACGRALELTDDQLRASREILADYGNMSSPTVLFILERLRRQHAGGPCVALAFGPGLTIEAALLVQPGWDAARRR